MPVIDALACPFQRAALLVARWSGARRDEIRRCRSTAWTATPTAPRDCASRAARPTSERVVPLHQDAAAALQQVIDLRKRRARATLHRRAHRRGDPLPVHEPRQAALNPLPVRDPDPAGLQDRRPGAPRRARRHRTRHRHRPPLPPHRRHPARRARREAAHDHEGPRPHVGEHGARLRPDQRPASAARLPGSTRTRSDDRRASRRKSSATARSPTPRSTGSRPTSSRPSSSSGRCLRLPGRRAVRVRPLPHLREVRHHARIRAASPRPPQGRAGARRSTPPLTAGTAKSNVTAAQADASSSSSPSSASPSTIQTTTHRRMILTCPHKVVPGLRFGASVRVRPDAEDP